MLLEYIIWAFVFYWLFRFVFNFLVPVFRVTKQMKEQVRDFQNTPTGQHYQQPNKQYTTTNTGSSTSATQPKPKSDDYIDFEEIK